MPSARHYWLIEHDVLFDLEHMSEFFAHFEAHPEYDFLAGWYQIHGNQWANTAAMLPFADPVYGCLFPVVRVSAAAADHLAVERGRVSEAFLAGHVKIVPNDEAFTASVLTTAGYRCADLNSLGREFYKREEFCFGPPVPRRVFGGVGQPRTGRIHHPVASGETLRRKATEWLYRAPDAMFHSRAATAAEAIRTELGDAVGATFDATVVETAARFR
ncbi:MAG: hypothetical protein DDT39_01694 [Firmicutes bacterium]|nr:hypothetical protein [candidate division NPL-UPA2 bacterium]